MQRIGGYSMDKNELFFKKISTLIEKGIEEGKITEDELSEIFEGIILSDDQMDAIYNCFSNAQIEIVDSPVEELDEEEKANEEFEIVYIPEEDNFRRYLR